jgi:WD40 repeat protein
VWSLTFSPDSTRLASAGADQTAGFWDLGFWKRPLSDWNEAGCRMVNRNLSRAEWDQFARGLAYQQTCPTLPVGEGAG